MVVETENSFHQRMNPTLAIVVIAIRRNSATKLETFFSYRVLARHQFTGNFPFCA